MNQIFSVVWSDTRQKFIVASEFACGKDNRLRYTFRRVLAGLIAALLASWVNAETLDWFGEGAPQTMAVVSMVTYHDNTF